MAESNVVSLLAARLGKTLAQAVDQMPPTEKILPEFDLSHMGDDIVFMPLYRPAHGDETRGRIELFVYGVEGKAVRPLAVIRMSEMQWKNMVEAGARVVPIDGLLSLFKY